MDFTRPLATVTPTLDGGVLAALARAEANFTTGQLRRLLGDHSEEGIRRVLRRLVEQGIVTSERVGNAFAYRFNREHLAADHVLGLAHLFEDFLFRLSGLLGQWKVPPVYAAVFGSVARRSMTNSSDIDLFVVRPDAVADEIWDFQVAGCVDQVAKWTGNDLRLLEFTGAELRARSAGEPVFRDVVAHGLTVAGQRTWLIRQLTRKE
ncbi:nucleotidyltransferase domain-containing protein [Actinokineospora sp. PR83]|uniref:nucleotidyltransferase domain-containing protein n=1 Tax=Actinokineospora sp. PR83 TaxID=2884908 RepID=UPI0027E18002|nr:nucleotidyltransferase domain-containing protein [Actinokineospora sp. PR83]MCG8920047.1 nucleotidyltransferase domain-containing protein [Actinokineospora sp. PR83]